jgi:hypothetical protein
VTRYLSHREKQIETQERQQQVGGIVASTSAQQRNGQHFIHHWFRRETVRRALTVAGIVGPILTVINQYDVLWRLEFSPRFWMKVMLTFLVPYCVSSFSSARAYMEQEARERGLREENPSQQLAVNVFPKKEN